MNWALLTPQRRAYWSQQKLSFPVWPQSETPSKDVLEDSLAGLLCINFQSGARQSESDETALPVRHWQHCRKCGYFPAL